VREILAANGDDLINRGLPDYQRKPRYRFLEKVGDWAWLNRFRRGRRRGFVYH
jgi:hypothetical protein